MPVNHNINVRLTGGTHGSKTSAKNSVKNSLQKTSESGSSTPRKLSKGIKTAVAKDVGSFGIFGGAGAVVMLGIKEAIKYTNVALDIYVDITQASTGEKIRAGNFKRIKGYILDPMSYAVEGTYGVFLKNLETNRYNKENDYYRELTGNLIVSKQFGEKR